MLGFSRDLPSFKEFTKQQYGLSPRQLDWSDYTLKICDLQLRLLFFHKGLMKRRFVMKMI